MQIYDTIILLVVLIAAFYGWRKGLLATIRGIVSVIASIVVAINFRHTLAQHIDATPPFNTGAAMLILLLGTSVGVWLLFRPIRSTIESLKLGEFDHHMGAFFGAGLGFLLSCVITLIAVQLLSADTLQGTIIGSKSGYMITSFLNQAHSVMPAELHDHLEPFLHARLERLNEQMGSGHQLDHPNHAGNPASYGGNPPTYGQTPTGGQYGQQPAPAQQQPTYGAYGNQPPRTAPAGGYPPATYSPGTYPPTAPANSQPNYGSQVPQQYQVNPPRYAPAAAPPAGYQPPGNWATPANPTTTAPRF